MSVHLVLLIYSNITTAMKSSLSVWCALRRMRRLDFILLQLFIIHLSRSHQRLSDGAAAAAAAYLLFGSNK